MKKLCDGLVSVIGWGGVAASLGWRRHHFYKWIGPVFQSILIGYCVARPGESGENRPDDWPFGMPIND